MFDTLQTAIGHHQAGRLDEAERLYHQLLREDAGHADALHLLGVVAHQRGRHAQAIDTIGRAIGLNPHSAIYHGNLAEAHRALGDLDRTEHHCREALRIQPNGAEALNNLGLVLQQRGRPDEALPLFEAALSRKPHWPMPFLNLGNLHRDQGRPYDAVAVYREGVRLCGDAPLLRNNLGEVLLKLGRVEEALPYCQEAARLRPDQPPALINFGNALAAAGRRDEARAQYHQALRLNPNLAVVFHRLAVLAQSEGKFADASNLLDEAIRRDPNDPEPQCLAGIILWETDRGRDAVTRLRELVTKFPNHVQGHSSLGFVLQDVGDMPGALDAYREAVRLKPDFADAHLNLGLLLTEMGEVESAVVSLREALKYDPHHPEALSALGMVLRDKITPSEEAAAERALASGRIPGPRRAVLQYGLAQVMDARGLIPRAAGLAMQANETMKALARDRDQGYSADDHRDYADRIIRAYSAAHFERVRGWGSDSTVPIFIVGLPRSGTSLVEQILASHPKVFGAGELNDMRDIYRSLPGLVGKQAPGIDCVGDLTRELVQSLSARYLDRVRSLATDAARIVDKMPDNYLMLGLIATLFPQAKIIHTLRDVRDSGLSCWLTHFKHIKWACDLEQIGHRIRDYVRLMDHWRDVLPGRFMEVQYETVVADLEPQARRLLDWCGLEWDPACLAFHQTKRVVRTASMAQVREPLYQRSVRRWERYREFIAPMLAIVERGERIE